MKIRSSLLPLLLMLAGQLTFAQAPYQLDTLAFGTNGYVIPTYPGSDLGYGLVIDSTNGSITTVGTLNSECVVSRFSWNGAPDEAFGAFGKTTFKFTTGNTNGKAIAVQADGKIVVTGYTAYENVGVARLLPNGTLDPTFGTGGKSFLPLAGINAPDRMGLGIQADGKIVLLAQANDPDNLDEPSATLLRFLPNGSLDFTFSGDGKAFLDLHPGAETANALAIQADGRIVVVGSTGNNGADGALIGRLLPNGAPDLSWGSGGVLKTYGAVFYDVAIQPDGKIVAAGESGVSIVARFLPNGNYDAAFGSGGLTTLPGGRNVANGVAVQPDGKVVIVGFARTGGVIFGFNYYFYVARLHANGTVDASTFPGNVGAIAWKIGEDEELHKVALQPDGGIVAIGYYRNSFAQNDLVLLRLITGPDAPTASFTATNTSGCGPLTVQFTNASSANAQAFNWQFPGGTPSSSTAQNPTVVYNTAGSYSVTLTVSNTAGTNNTTQANLVIVNPGPTAAFSSIVSGTTASFTNTSANATTYSWNFGDNTTATTATPSHTYTADGTYSVTLTATNSCGVSTSTQSVVIATPPTAGFTATNTSGCGPLTVQFTNASSANAQTFHWQFPGGSPATSTAQHPLVTYVSPGTYPVTLTASNGSGSSTEVKTAFITIGSLPTAAFSSSVIGDSATFHNTSSGANTYHWDFGDGQTSTAVQPSHTYTASGTYTVALTVTNACGSGILEQTIVVVLVAAGEPVWLEQVRVSPNPTTGIFAVEIKGGPTKRATLALLHPVGGILETHTIDLAGGAWQRQFDLSGLPAGIYLLRLGDDTGKVAWRRIVKQ